MPSASQANSCKNLYVVILAGGIGTRLWPRSRQALPKQFVDISGQGRTMIQSTVDRVADLVPPERIYVVTGHAYADLVSEQIPSLSRSQILVEPEGRNTAPAIGLASAVIGAVNPGAILAVLPSDHVIAKPKRFREALLRALTLAQEGWLATLGITPRSPKTGYGYIQRGRQLDRFPSAPQPFSVQRFHEKPDLETALHFVESGECFWNGGIFVFHVDRMLAEIQARLPDIAKGLHDIRSALQSPEDECARQHRLQQTIEQVWPSMTNISIDHGVMEAATNVAVVPLDAGWNDVGTWDALASVIEPDVNGNVTVGDAVLTLDSSNNIVYSDHQYVALVSMQDCVVVATGDSLLIGSKHEMQRVKEIVQQLRDMNRADLL